jgi:hypothetical protein
MGNEARLAKIVVETPTTCSIELQKMKVQKELNALTEQMVAPRKSQR